MGRVETSSTQVGSLSQSIAIGTETSSYECEEVHIATSRPKQQTTIIDDKIRADWKMFIKLSSWAKFQPIP